MRRFTALTSLYVASMLSFSAEAVPLKVCHIANAGFFAESNEEALVVDAVMERDNYNGTFALPSASTLASLQQGKAAFQHVKLALVTHHHGDHFDAVATLTHLRNNEVVQYIMPPEASQLLENAGLSDAERPRVHSVLPNWDKGPTNLTVNGIDVEVYRIDHGPNMPQNLGYKATLGGKTVFHTGDINASAERLKSAGLGGTAVDFMLMPFWYLLQQKEDIATAWDIGTMIPMHYHAAAQPWMEQFGGPTGLRATAEREWPGAVRIDQEMQCEIFE